MAFKRKSYTSLAAAKAAIPCFIERAIAIIMVVTSMLIYAVDR